ncbi:hypothetical protein KC953_01505 [Candidatus Saccharibacteria bacterium]|nr:hypothetical protein [Candidatus Saccharibacteria bacterium]
MNDIVWLLFGIFFLFGFVVFRGAPYLPSKQRYARLALTKLYRIRSQDVLVDLGSGDGQILRLATSLGARAIGYELNPILVVISRLLARGDGRQKTRLADMWLVDLPAETTIVYVFSVSRDSYKLTDRLTSHVEKHGKKIWCITFGAGLGGVKPVKRLHAHNLYLFDPKISLQRP